MALQKASSNLITKSHEKVMQQTATNLTRTSHNDLETMKSHTQENLLKSLKAQKA
jgi:hypothetical protein